ncbi:MAG: hypothetical protein RIQ62_1084 [Bacteroidota bacterium]
MQGTDSIRKGKDDHVDNAKLVEYFGALILLHPSSWVPAFHDKSLLRCGLSITIRQPLSLGFILCRSYPSTLDGVLNHFWVTHKMNNLNLLITLLLCLCFVKRLPTFVVYLLTLYTTSVLAMALLRAGWLSYIVGPHFYQTADIGKAFLIGAQFDSVVLAYVLALPFVLLFLNSLTHGRLQQASRFLLVYIPLIFSLILFLLIADIPYFAFFQNRITEAAFQWMDTPGMVGQMIWSNDTYKVFLLVTLLLLFVTARITYRYTKRFLQQKVNEQISWQQHLFLFLILGSLCFMGMRGRINNPIMINDACYSNNPILNQAGLNPAFTLLKSYFGRVSLMDEAQAQQLSLTYLDITPNAPSISPIARTVNGQAKAKPVNIVLVLMEGMSARFMTRFGNPNHLTPTLDSLAQHSLFFDHAYSAGIHTNNGVFSTLYGLPALRRTRPMCTVPVRRYSGLPYALKQHHYQNFFFCTHSNRFDNLGEFIPRNSFDTLIAAECFPAEACIGPFGVVDDYLFTRVIHHLNQQDSSRPFFTTILTASNHDPYVLPTYFSSNQATQELKAVSYADWSIASFLQQASSCSWFTNTVFVFVADHGRVVGQNPYDLPFSYNQIPIIMYAPGKQIRPQICSRLMGQIDVFPTLMGLLGLSYTNNTLGVDVLNHNRPCMYFSADDKLGCINDNWLYIYRYQGKHSLHAYQQQSSVDYSEARPDVLKQLRNYALSQTQMAEWMIAHDKTYISTK